MYLVKKSCTVLYCIREWAGPWFPDTFFWKLSGFGWGDFKRARTKTALRKAERNEIWASANGKLQHRSQGRLHHRRGHLHRRPAGIQFWHLRWRWEGPCLSRASHIRSKGIFLLFIFPPSILISSFFLWLVFISLLPVLRGLFSRQIN